MRNLSAFICVVALAGGCGRGLPSYTNKMHESDKGAIPREDPVETPNKDPVIECSKPFAKVADGICAVTPGTDGLLIHANIIGPDAMWKGGSLLIDASGMIACAGCDCMSDTAKKLECPDAVVSAGLINAHDHLGWANLEPKSHAERYDQRHDWRNGQRNDTKVITSGSSAAAVSVQLGELRFILSGATSTIASNAADHFMRNLDDDVQEGLGKPPVQYETFPLSDTNGTQLASGCAYPGFKAVAPGHSAYFPHVSEGIDKEAHNEFTCLSSTANGGHDIVNAETAMIHSIALNVQDVMLLAEKKTSVVWSPRTNTDLYGYTASVTLMDRLGVNIALGTDWLPSGSMNMSREFACVDSLNKTQYASYFSNKKILDMATINASRAAHMDDVLGSLAPGKFADIAMFKGAAKAYRAVIEGEPKDVVLVLRGGVPLYGDDALVAALAPNTDCEPLDVCTVGKRVCVQREVGMSLVELQAAAAHRYALFSCGAPQNEPSCTPFRDNEDGDGIVFKGMAETDDLDGDGVLDTNDNCPDIFNAPRPMDDVGGMRMQADFDLDGVGDVCDPCPIDPDSMACVNDLSRDRDGDGRVDVDDNCPDVPNFEQDDTDGDGKGDVCDTPSTPLYLSEVLVNPTGPDAGFEWVKLYNPSTTDVLLTGYAIGFGGAVTYSGAGSGLVQLSGTIGAGKCMLFHEGQSGPSNGSPAIATAPVGFSAPRAIDFPGASGLQQPDASAPDAVALFGPASNAIPLDLVVYALAPSVPVITSDFISPSGAKQTVQIYAADVMEGKSLLRASLTDWTASPAMTPNACIAVL